MSKVIRNRVRTLSLLAALAFGVQLAQPHVALAAASISMLKSVSINNGGYGTGGSASPGQGLTYALQYNNSGSSDATNVVVTDTLAAGQQLVAYSAGCSAATNAGVVTITCATASVPAFPAIGSTGTFYISTRIVSGFAGTIPNTATISASNAAQSNSNTTSVSVGVTPGNGSLQKFVSVNGNAYGQSFNANPGDTLVYDIEYTNPLGSPTAQNVVIYDTLQPGQTLLVFQGASAYCTSFTPGTSTLVCPVGNVAPGQTVRVHISTTITQFFSGQITNQATESSSGGPSLVSNTTLIQVGTPGPVFGTNLTLCGTVTSFTGNSITVSGVTLSIAPGAIGTGSPVTGTNECISFQFNSVGQVSSLVVSSNLAGVGAICGVYTTANSPGTIRVGGVTVASSFSTNVQYFLTPGAYYCFLLTPNGVAYAVLTGTPTAATRAGQGGHGFNGNRERTL